MTLHLKMPSKVNNLSPKISVIGVGGAGGNVINSMIKSGIDGVSFLTVNTDSQALKNSEASETLQLGPSCTQGLGAGADPEIGRDSAVEVESEIREYLENTNMVFITAGMGGGTGTGASPIIAKIAKELDILIVGVVTKPLDYEGKRRMEQAIQGINELQKYVDNLIIIPNQNIFHLAKTDTTYTDAFKLANNVLIDGVKSIMDLMLKPGIINHDFADVRAVMSESGKVHMGTAISEEEDRASKATEEAISNPLLEYNSMSGAKGVLVNITGGEDITLHEVDQAMNVIKEQADEDVNLIWGLTKDENFSGKFKISVISTGIDSDSFLKNQIDDINVKEFQEYKNQFSENDRKQKTIETDLDMSNNENITEEKKQENFFVDLTGDKNTNIIHPENKIRELEEKAMEFKNDDEKKPSFLSKIFGNKDSIKKGENSIHNTSLGINTSEEEKISENKIDEYNYTSEELNLDYTKMQNNQNNLEDNQSLGINDDANNNYEEDLLQIPAFLRRQAN